MVSYMHGKVDSRLKMWQTNRNLHVIFRQTEETWRLYHVNEVKEKERR